MYKKTTQTIAFFVTVGMLQTMSLQAIPDIPEVDTAIIDSHRMQEFTDTQVQNDVTRTTRYHSYSQGVKKNLENHKIYHGSALALGSLGCFVSGIATAGFGLKSLGYNVHAASLPSTGYPFIDQSSFVNTTATIIGGFVTYYTYGMVKNAWKNLKATNILLERQIETKDLPPKNELIQRHATQYPGLAWFRIWQEEKAARK